MVILLTSESLRLNASLLFCHPQGHGTNCSVLSRGLSPLVGVFPERRVKIDLENG